MVNECLSVAVTDSKEVGYLSVQLVNSRFFLGASLVVIHFADIENIIWLQLVLYFYVAG